MAREELEALKDEQAAKATEYALQQLLKSREGPGLTMLIGADNYRVWLEETGRIHWLTLDHLAKPFRKAMGRLTPTR